MFAYSYALLSRALADRKGVTALEYGVIAAVTVVAVAAAIVPVQNALTGIFGSVVTALAP
jgi:Flp pilus assembly pilin Flp